MSTAARRGYVPRTKIVCTIGPASRSFQAIEGLVSTGMDVARLNFSHGTQADHDEVISLIRQVSEKTGHPVAILQDLAGTKIRLGKIELGQVVLEAGRSFTLTSKNVPGNHRSVTVNYSGLVADVAPGATVLLSDGAIELEVLETTDEDVLCRVVVGGSISSHKGVNLPTSSLNVTSFTVKDQDDLAFGIGRGVDYVATSFVRTVEDVLAIKRFIEEHNSLIPIVAKIEKWEAVENIDDIVRAVDGIMVARGDLGVEVPLEQVPRIQKMLIEKSNRAGKPVITATQMLGSMVDSPRPTRAEVTDVANAVLDGTDALMLSEETAIGKYPIETVGTMAKIAEEAESIFPFDNWDRWTRADGGDDLPEAVARAACKLAEESNVAAIVTFTQSGSTARLVAKCRPRTPILASTPNELTYRHLAIVWGVVPFLSEAMADTDEMIDEALGAALRSGLVKSGQNVVITAGVPVGEVGNTNLVKVQTL